MVNFLVLIVLLIFNIIDIVSSSLNNTRGSLGFTDEPKFGEVHSDEVDKS